MCCKTLAALRERNYRVRPNSTLSRCCAPALVLESILLNLVVKIVLQHIQRVKRTDLLVVSLSAHDPYPSSGVDLAVMHKHSVRVQRCAIVIGCSPQSEGENMSTSELSGSWTYRSFNPTFAGT